MDELRPIIVDAGEGKQKPQSCSNSSPHRHFLIADEFGMVQNAEEQYLRDIGYKRHAFNILVSSKIGLLRDIPDTRHKL